LYTSLLQPILHLLLQPTQDGVVEEGDEVPPSIVDGQNTFLNVSVTPIECSVVCHTAWAKKLFEPAIRKLPRDVARQVSISRDSFSVFSVISAGMDAGSRVVDLTSPLALAGVTIFFITTYYSDFILVPTKDRQSVVQALLARGFEFSEDGSSFTSPSVHSRGPSQGSTTAPADQPPPSTPPPSSVAELQVRTFDLFRRRNVMPYIEPGLRLVQCSGREKTGRGAVGPYGYTEQRPSLSRTHTETGSMGGGGSNNGNRHSHYYGGGSSWVDKVDAKLYAALMAALVLQPRFLSVTLAQDDPASLMLDHSLLNLFGDAVVGDTEGNLVPIFLDLVNLPFEATGIVSGVAGKLVQELHMLDSAELSYLSTARAGAVILSCEHSIRALEILKPLVAKKE
jgi:hypothetical protein